MRTLKEIDQILKKYKGELYTKYKVKEIGIFGSFVRRKQKKRSDIDILVEFEEVPDLLTFINLERYLSKLLKKRVDLVEKSSIRPRLKNIILNEVFYV